MPTRIEVTIGEDADRATVLVVDDELDCRELLAAALESEHYRVHVACNGREALALLEQLPRVDVIVLDLMMPVMTGWDLLAAIREQPRLASIPVLVTSAAFDVRARDLSGAELVPKPIRLEAFLDIVGERCGQVRAQSS